jgi:hypothetical protein
MRSRIAPNQPRLQDDGADTLLSAECERFDEMAEIVADALDHMPSVRSEDRNIRAAALVGWALQCGADPEDVAAVAKKAAATPTTN